MTVAIMQPYFFPYIGYFQLINSVDSFVFYDDVNYIKQGWINRNRILLNGANHMLTLQVVSSSSFKKINEITVGNKNSKILKTIVQAYIKAPYFNETFPLIENILLYTEKNLAKFIQNAIVQISSHLEINTKLIVSSHIDKNLELRGKDKVISICKQLGATRYINSIGGQQLYDKKEFQDAGIQLCFIKPKLVEYKQLNNSFIPGLSILDVLMFNGKNKTKDLLTEFELV
jgi:hypothetical protein